MTIELHASGNPDEVRGIHDRWIQRRNRRTDDPQYRDEWYDQQCGGCRYWFPLAGKIGLDYGACANKKSPFDGTVRFEHDGCEFFEESEGWATPGES